MTDAVVRRMVVELLEGGQAHITADAALADLPSKLRHVRPSAEVRSIWEELEHMRRAQEDILRFTLDPSWQSPPWPDGYWPDAAEPLSDAAWAATIEGFHADLKKAIEVVRDERIDLTAKIPHGQGQTYLREALLIADHNAYHLGQVAMLRKLLGSPPA